MTGGNATLTAEFSGTTVTMDFEIRGDNPAGATVSNICGEDEVRGVCWHESSCRQFVTTGADRGLPLPCYARDGGYGIMQLTYPGFTISAEDKLWHWSRNLDFGINHLRTCYTRAQNALRRNYAASVANGHPWNWNPDDARYGDRIWNDAFSRYNTGSGLYNANGVVSNRNGQAYVDRVRATIRTSPWP